MKKAVILIGPIGSGKGTQADILAEKFGFIHLETSKLLEYEFKNGDQSDPKLIEQRKLWESGILCDPEWVTDLTLKEIDRLAEQGKGIVFSASPRTLFEVERQAPELEKVFGKENIHIFHIGLSEAESIKRNSGRRICEENRHPIPNFPEFKDMTACPRDGSKLLTRELDKPEIIKVRYQEYLNRTFPILGYLQERDYKIIRINGEQSIEKVSEDILKSLND
ncbi:MAG TPA: nucleoside monophosphate kinase [Candidatus Paceibacterota bacterium]